MNLNIPDPDGFDQASEALRKLFRRPEPKPEPKGRTVAELVPVYLAAAPGLEPTTAVGYGQRLAWLVTRFGSVTVDDLQPAELEAAVWREGWGAATVRLTLSVVQVFVRWAGRPTFKLKGPPMPVRDEQCVITKAEFRAIMAECQGDLGPLFKVLFLTGCRPNEVRGMTAEMVSLAGKRVTLDRHKTRKKTGRPKVVPLSDAALGVLAVQMAKYGRGYLFRDEKGRQLTYPTIWGRLTRIKKRLGLRREVCLYSFRHSFATHLLEGGASSREVAKLLGHTTTAMVEAVYGHFLDLDRLRSVAGRMNDAG